MCTERRPALRRPQRGLTMIELIMFIMIVSVGLAGILTVFTTVTKSSADPMVRKQMLAIAEALIEEARLQPFTWCDPDDPAAATATSTTSCTTTNQDSPTPGETRGSTTTPLDNVIDYHGLSLASPIPSLSGNYSAPAGYSATITVAADTGLGPAGSLIPNPDALRITVTVSHGADSLSLDAYRTRHSPTALP